jgi:hypothetical protein
VNDECVLDAGTCEPADASGGIIIRPPKVTLFHQLLAYLRSKPDPADVRPRETRGSREGMATTALVLRWGTYLCVLADQDKPAWREIHNPEVRRIGGGEMARINIEASAALAEWIDMVRLGGSEVERARLIDKALAYLPMPKPVPPTLVADFGTLAEPEITAAFAKLWLPKNAHHLPVAEHATRMLANALINVAWRIGPVEDIHAGSLVRGYPMDLRRISPSEDRNLMTEAARRFAFGMSVCHGLAERERVQPWSELIAPYGLATFTRVPPTDWSLTEDSREVRLNPTAQ